MVSVVVMLDGEGDISVFSTGLETPNAISILRVLCFKKGELSLLQVSCSWFLLHNITFGLSLSLFHGDSPLLDQLLFTLQTPYFV